MSIWVLPLYYYVNSPLIIPYSHFSNNYFQKHHLKVWTEQIKHKVGFYMSLADIKVLIFKARKMVVYHAFSGRFANYWLKYTSWTILQPYCRIRPYVLFLQFRPLNGVFIINWQKNRTTELLYEHLYKKGQNHDTQLSFKDLHQIIRSLQESVT